MIASVVRALFFFFFQDLPMVGLEQEDHPDGQKDFGFGLVEQARGGTSLSLSSMRISFNYVTSYHSAFSIVLV